MAATLAARVFINVNAHAGGELAGHAGGRIDAIAAYATKTGIRQHLSAASRTIHMTTPLDFFLMMATASSAVLAKSSALTSSSLTTKCRCHSLTIGGQHSPSSTRGRGSITFVWILFHTRDNSVTVPIP